MRLLITLIVLLSCQLNLYADSYRFFTRENSNLAEVHYEIWQQQDKWVVSTFKRFENEFKRKANESFFSNYYEASFHFEKLKSRVNKDQNLLVLDLPEVKTEVQGKVIWDVENDWNIEWEKRYAVWIESEVDLEFYRRYNLRVDCADVAYTLRWIFARNNKLPAVATFLTENIPFTQDSFLREMKGKSKSSKWFEDEVFMIALRYLARSFSTKTLIHDLYPVKLNRELLIPGRIYMTKGHTRVIRKVTTDGESYPIVFHYGTVPASKNIYNEFFFISQHVANRSEGGILGFRWPVRSENYWTLAPEAEMPGYSREQYENIGKERFYDSVFKKLEIVINPKKVISSIVKNMVELLGVRKMIVEQGEIFCKKQECLEKAARGSRAHANYDDWSTPSRDKRMATLFKELGYFSRRNNLTPFYKEELQGHHIVINGQELSLSSLSDMFIFKRISGNPNDSIAMRWGTTSEVVQAYLTLEVQRKDKQRVFFNDGCIVEGGDCSVGGSIWNAHERFGLDQQIKRITASFVDYCLDEKHSCLDIHNETILNSVLKVSDPLHQSSLVAPSDLVFMPKFKSSLEQIDDENFIIDNNKIYNIKKTKLALGDKNTESLFFLAKEKLWVELSKDYGMRLFDQDRKLIGESNLFSNPPETEIKNFKSKVVNNEHLAISYCLKSGCTSFLYKVTKDKLFEVVKNYGHVAIDHFERRSEFLNGNGTCFSSKEFWGYDCFYSTVGKLKVEKITNTRDKFYTNPMIEQNVLFSAISKTGSVEVIEFNKNRKKTYLKINGWLRDVKSLGRNLFFLKTSENNKTECHVVNLDNSSKVTVGCSQAVSEVINESDVYTRNDKQEWFVSMNAQAWENLGKREYPIGIDKDNMLFFASQLGTRKFEKLSCLNKTGGNLYPCFGKNAKYEATRSNEIFLSSLNRILVNYLDGDQAKSSFQWERVYGRNLYVKLLRGNLYKYTRENYYYEK